MSHKGIILDMDGTLYQMTEEYILYQRWYEKKALMMSLNANQDQIELWWECIARNLKSKLGRDPSAREIILQFPGITLSWLNSVREGLDPSSYVSSDSDLINYINTSKDLRMVVLSTSPNGLIRKFLRILGLPEKKFLGILGVDNMINSKPHPEGFIKAGRILGGDYKNIWSFGDRYEFDILPAIGLGMNGCLVQGPTDLFNKIIQI
jgi:FMN phosphatase YigB (HAD superfamily)